MYVHGYGAIPSNESDIAAFQSSLRDDLKPEITKSSSLDNSFSNKKYVHILMSFVVAIIIIFAISYNGTSFTPSSLRNISKDSKWEFVVANEYGIATKEKYPYSFIASNLFAETYKTNEVTLLGTSESCDYSYTITGITDDSFSETGVLVDSIFQFKPTSPGEYELTINENCDGVDLIATTRTVWSKYVRRELTSLTDNDREDFLDAFRTLWDLSTSEGIKLYGDAYKGLYNFATIHNDAGAFPVASCDEFHGGSGFINNHVMFGTYLEQSLQLINPAVSLHYMNYIQYFSSDAFDAHQKDTLDGGTWTELMTSKYFGSNDPLTGRIIDGRWANLTIPYITDDFLTSEKISTTEIYFPSEEKQYWSIKDTAHSHSPYGLLRPPWNYNPSTYVARFNNIDRVSDMTATSSNYYIGVDCTIYDTFIQAMKGQSLQTFLYDVELQTHGHVHFTIAGVGGAKANDVNNELKSKYGLTDFDLVVMDNSGHAFFKNFITWMSTYPDDSSTNYLSCTNAWDDTTQTMTATSDASCSCNSNSLASTPEMDKMIYEIFSDWTSDEPEYDTVTKVISMKDETKKEFLSSFCGRYSYEGDLAGSSAAVDPLFWVVHGALEKLYQKTMMENWLSDDTYVSSTEGSCSGHDASGTKYWLTGFNFADSSIDAASLTNAELSKILDPRNDLYRDNINFIYDHSDWSTVCEDYDITLFADSS